MESRIRAIRQYCLRNQYSLRQVMSGQPTLLSFDWIEKYLPQDLITHLIPKDTTPTQNSTLDRFQLLQEVEGGQPTFVIVIPSYNNEKWVNVNLQSVLSQTYPFFRVIYINDGSTDDTHQKVQQIIRLYHSKNRIKYLQQPHRQSQACGRFQAYHMCDDDEILCMVDGDDWLANPQVLYHLAKIYQGSALSTYGSFQFFHQGRLEKPVYGREYFEKQVINGKMFRYSRWVSCHLRTGYAGLFKRIRLQDLLESNQDKFYRCCTDLAEMYPVLEMAAPHIQMVSQALYVYNKDASLLNSNSFFNQTKFPREKMYREMIQSQLQGKSSYPTISKKTLFSDKTQHVIVEHRRDGDGIGADYIAVGDSLLFEKHMMALAKLLDATQLPLLGIQLDIDISGYLYSTDVCFGRLKSSKPRMREYLVANSRQNDVESGELVGELVISVGRPEIAIIEALFGER